MVQVCAVSRLCGLAKQQAAFVHRRTRLDLGLGGNSSRCVAVVAVPPDSDEVPSESLLRVSSITKFSKVCLASLSWPRARNLAEWGSGPLPRKPELTGADSRVTVPSAVGKLGNKDNRRDAAPATNVSAIKQSWDRSTDTCHKFTVLESANRTVRALTG